MRTLPLFAALLIGTAVPAHAQDANLVYLQTIVWQGGAEANFGGFSGLEVLPDGLGFIALSDRGWITEGRLVRDEDGRISAIDAAALRPLDNGSGGRLTERRSDSEGIALAPDGEIFISFEGATRVRTETGPDGVPHALPRPPAFRALDNNASLEALAIGPDGRLYTIPERSGRLDRPFPVYCYDGAAWDVAFDLPRIGPFLPVGADVGPDGLLYILERDFTGFGFRTRIRRVALDGSGLETLLVTSRHDNLEGLSVWQAADGLRLTMISDDNFNWLQRTEIVEYRLQD
jgi:hypothetical protein